MRKIKAIWHLIFAKGFIIYTDGRIDWQNVAVQDARKLTEKLCLAEYVVEQQAQQQANLNEVNRILNK